MSLSQAEKSKRWRQRDPERARAHLLKYRYGITMEEYSRLLAEQGGCCAICKGTPGHRRLDVDHDHVTGKVRGLLCHMCNTGIAKFRDNIVLLEATITYLKGETPCL